MMTYILLKSTNDVKDVGQLRDIIQLYSDDKFEEMIVAADKYGKSFFFDLWRFLDAQTYRSVLNKYMIFVQITLQYHKDYT